jgi:hypothetical protein
MRIAPGFSKCTVPEGVSGAWAIERYTLDRTYEPQQGFATVMQYVTGNPVRAVPPGSYTRLVRADSDARVVVMSDTPAEMREHSAFVRRAAKHHAARVLVFGLGLGVCIDALLKRRTVAHVDVVELSSDVRALVGSHLLTRWGAARLTIHAGDAHTWEPPDPSARWHETWFDIWDAISDSNLPEMATLKARFAARTWNESVACWGEPQAIRMAAAYEAIEQLSTEDTADLPVPDRIELLRRRTHEIVLKQARMGTRRMAV